MFDVLMWILLIDFYEINITKLIESIIFDKLSLRIFILVFLTFIISNNLS